MIYAKIDLSATKIETLQRQVYFDTVRERFNQQFNDKRVQERYDGINVKTLLVYNRGGMHYESERCVSLSKQTQKPYV